MKPTFLTLVLAGITFSMLLAPLAVDATVFQNPLGDTFRFDQILRRLILWLLGLAGFLGLLALVVGGIYIILGAFAAKEANYKLGKQIITWAIIGLLVIGMAATILFTISQILGVRSGFRPPGGGGGLGS